MTSKTTTTSIYITVIFLLGSLFCNYGSSLYAQQHPVKFGVEADVLPYALGGYMGAAWVGKGHLRLRTLYAKVNMPGLVVPDEFTNQQIRSMAVLADYFLQEGFRGWWAGGGYVHWNGSIETADRSAEADYKTHLLNGSAGYQFSFGPHFYLGPWAGLSIRVAGDRDIEVGTETFDPPLLNPELSFKLGWEF